MGEAAENQGMPTTCEEPLARLPEALRVAVPWHFGLGTSKETVGAAVGANDSAAEAEGSDGAVTR